MARSGNITADELTDLVFILRTRATQLEQQAERLRLGGVRIDGATRPRRIREDLRGLSAQIAASLVREGVADRVM